MVGVINEKANTVETVVQGHCASGRVNSVSAHPTRQLIISASSDRTARVWDLESRVKHSLFNQKNKRSSSY